MRRASQLTTQRNRRRHPPPTSRCFLRSLEMTGRTDEAELLYKVCDDLERARASERVGCGSWRLRSRGHRHHDEASLESERAICVVVRGAYGVAGVVAMTKRHPTTPPPHHPTASAALDLRTCSRRSGACAGTTTRRRSTRRTGSPTCSPR